MKAYSLDLRERIVQAVQDGLSQPEVARQFRVSRATVERYWRLQRSGQTLAPCRNPGSPPRLLLPEQHVVLLRQLQAHPDWTLPEHTALWCEQYGPVSVATLGRRVRALQWTRKKDDPCR